MMRSLVPALTVVLLAGCPDGPEATLTVRIQTGLRAEHEVRYADAALVAGARACREVDDFADGREIVATDQAALVDGSFTVREIADLAPGVYTVRARVRRPPPDAGGDPEDGATLLTRCVTVSITGSRVLRIPLTSDCVNVECPAPAGSAAFSECLAGRCVDPRCDPDDPSTAELCCDRALLGDACDDDPTLCRSSEDCEATIACAGTPSCEASVCVEPVEDTCSEGTYCSAESNRCDPEGGSVVADAGPVDAGLAPSDAGIDAFVSIDAFMLDAYVPLGLDAPFPDVSMSDASEPDASEPDASEPDASEPDAFAPDAPVTPDAFAPAGPEGSCSDGVDGDADRAIDCEDADCSAHPDCAGMPCVVGTARLDPEAAALPTSPSGPVVWWRDDANLVTRAYGVCGWGDGIRGLVLRPSSRSRAPLLTPVSGGSAVVMAPGDLLTVADGMALPPNHARTIVVIARHVSDGFTYPFATAATDRPGGLTGLRHDTSYAYDGSSRIGRAEGGLASGFVGEVLSMPTNHDPGTAALYISGVARTLTDEGAAAIVHAPDRQAVGSRASTCTVEIREILVYDRELSASERAMIDAYVASRLSVSG